MKVVDRYEAAYLRIKGFQTVGVRLEADSTRVVWDFEDAPALREARKQYAMGASAPVHLLRDQLNICWEEIKEVTAGLPVLGRA